MPSTVSTPTILVVSATSFCGSSALRWLSSALVSSPNSIPSKFGSAVPRIVGLTRDANSDASQTLAQLPGVEMLEKLWTEIDGQWLQEHNVCRVIMVPALSPSHFADESRFYVACKSANVVYLVKISTSSAGLVPDTPLDYVRTHWAVERLLRQPEFASMPSTILRPNAFLPTVYGTFIDSAKASPGQTFRVLYSEKAGIAAVDPSDVGGAATKLLLLPDPSAHAGKTYNLSGPCDVTGEQVTHLVEAKLARRLQVEYESESLLQEVAAHSAEMGRIARHQLTNYLRKGLSGIAVGGANVETSAELLALDIPRTTLQDFVDKAFQ